MKTYPFFASLALLLVACNNSDSAVADANAPPSTESPTPYKQDKQPTPPSDNDDTTSPQDSGQEPSSEETRKNEANEEDPSEEENTNALFNN